MNKQTKVSYTAYIGIDWADTKHDVCIQAAGEEHRTFTCLPHKTEEIEVWALDLHKRFDQEIAELAPKHPDYRLFDALPGAGPSLAPRLLVAFGEQRAAIQQRSRVTAIRRDCASDGT